MKEDPGSPGQVSLDRRSIIPYKWVKEKDMKKLTYAKVVRFTNDFDYLCSDGYILEILQGKININKLKSFIINYDGKPKICSEI